VFKQKAWGTCDHKTQYYRTAAYWLYFDLCMNYNLQVKGFSINSLVTCA